MKIYTKTGDQGQTSLFGGVKVPKDDLRLTTYGTLDEFNSILGIALSELGRAEFSDEPRSLLLFQRLQRVQNELFQLGAEMATPRGKATLSPLIEETHVQRLEIEIDEMEGHLQPLRSFILPGGCVVSSQLHLARTVIRRAEREMASLHRAEILRPEVLCYVNRLSDFLFVCARTVNSIAGVEDIPWATSRA
jgi:cob(I)alamin adenosyltransferase